MMYVFEGICIAAQTRFFYRFLRKRFTKLSDMFQSSRGTKPQILVTKSSCERIYRDDTCFFCPVSSCIRWMEHRYSAVLHFDFAEERAGQFMTVNWNPEEWRKIIKVEEKKAVSSLAQEIKALHKQIDDLRNTPLYQWKRSEKEGVSGYFYDILNKFYAEAAKAKSLSEEEIESADFKTNWLKTQQMTKDTLDRFDAVARPYAENDEIAQAAADIRKMLVLQALSDRYKVLHHEIEKLPLSKAEMDAFIAENSGKKNIFDFSPELAQETLGEFSFADQYNPETVK